MTHAAFQDTVTRGLREIGIEISSAQLESFCSYNELLLDWNRTINLTSITEPREVAIKHFVDSATVLNYHPEWSGTKLADVGSGAGFPGVVMKILKPEISLTLIDASNKRAAFLHRVITELGISDACVLSHRVETLGHQSEFREKFDVATARALATLPVAMELALPLLRVGGRLLAQRGHEEAAEIEEAEKVAGLLGGDVMEVSEFELPVLKDRRSIVTIAKISPTPARYPRALGMPQKRPLR